MGDGRLVRDAGFMDPNQPTSTLPPPPVAPPPPPPPRRSQPPPRPPDPPRDVRTSAETARSAAVWLGGTGAFLILVSAAVLVAVRWDDIEAWMKLAGLLTANVGIVTAGIRMRDRLPATAGALFHLGALLVPISATAATVQADLEWEQALLAASATTVVTLAALERVRPSKGLVVVTAAAAIPLAGGVAAVTGAPAGLVLGAAALVALQVRGVRGPPATWMALGWAAVAASLAVLLAIDDPVIRTSNVVESLGLASTVSAWVHLATGALAAYSFGLVAQRETSEGWALAAIGAVVVGTGATLTEVDSSTGTNGLSLVALAVGVEVAAYATRRLRPWSEVLAGLAIVAEVGMATATLWAAGHAIDAVASSAGTHSSVTLSAAVLALGWFVAGQRHRHDDCQSTSMALLTGGPWWPATLGLAIAIVATAGTTGSPELTAWTAVGTSIVLVAAGRAGGHAVAVGTTFVALITPLDDRMAAIVGGTLVLTLASAAALRQDHDRRGDAGAAGLLAAAIAAGVATTVSLESGFELADWSAALALVGLTVIATLVAERFSDDPVHAGTGVVGRGMLLVAFLPAAFGLGARALLPAGLLALAFVAVDIARSRDERLSLPLISVLPAVIVAAGLHADLTLAEAGVALAIAGAVLAGALAAVDRLSASSIGVVAALFMSAFMHAAAEPGTLSTVMMTIGGAGLVAAAIHRSIPAFLAAASLTAVGFWARLDLLDVTWSEPFLAPVAIALVVLGLARATVPLNSWWTHGAATALIGGAALLERIAGGHGGHALIAGIVATVAVALGAQFRLIGPLTTGTVLIVAVAAHESLAYTASVPTWAWLALAGSVLIGCALMIERSATSPVETGKRLLDTVKAGYR